ncbi:MAG: YbaK/EbsC family protein [Pseudobdellovibrionaceae bacterium]
MSFTTHLFEYIEKGGTSHSSQSLGVEEYQVIKTLVFRNQNRAPLIVLMHGTHQVDTTELAKQTGNKKISSTSPESALDITGYQVGGISPFATKQKALVYAEKTILPLKKLFINGGQRGFLVGITGEDLKTLLSPTPVQVAIQKK